MPTRVQEEDASTSRKGRKHGEQAGKPLLDAVLQDSQQEHNLDEFEDAKM